ncbi:alpha/beta hydrolase family protein [Allokutzneria sp. A3M-2-11 16]|uniref:alpha/beta hydrolase n=1 Tax=Allokutzneria sp. A3M-2-11 16 TaxID=2962043 RepID=UPI0020B7257F|nr:alpha/beta hydrolase [Allokutzneria sp. A3M-2-11 16]MCP3797769.1 alpha/beta hydrolase family protein [Allokutzneria sp. A3M-2-11 16]
MVSVSDVRRWRQPALDTAFQALGSRRDTLVGFDDELHATRSPAGWTGPAAEAATKHHGELTERMRRLVAGISAVRRAVGEAADAVKAVQRALGDAEHLAGRYGFSIADDGKIVDTAHPRPTDEAQVRERAAIQVELVDRVEQVLRRANDIDADLAAVLERAALDRIDDGAGASLTDASVAGQGAGGLSTIGPPQGGSPGDNAGWWSSLSDAERAAMLKDHPGWIGNLDGLPAVVRDQANRAQIPGERARLLAEAAKLEPLVDSLTKRLGASTSEIGELSIARQLAGPAAELATIKAKLASLDAIDETLARGDRQLLVFDPTGKQPKAAIAVGNVDTAEHVSVFTPGFSTTVAGSIREFDDHMKDLKSRAEAEAFRAEKPSSVAAVTWIGYEAPQLSEIPNANRSVATDALARQGADKLSGFLNGIDASRTTDPHLTALGHSYGSLTTGLALQKGTGVDDAVFFGSPGLGTSHVEELKVPAGHAWTVEARKDPVADFAAFGIDPNQMKGVGGLSAKEMSLPDGRQFTESVGHDSTAKKVGYLAPDSTSQYNMSLVIAGLHDKLARDKGMGIGDLLQTPIPGLY